MTKAKKSVKPRKAETNDDKIRKICKLIHVSNDFPTWNKMRHLSTRLLDKMVSALEQGTKRVGE